MKDCSVIKGQFSHIDESRFGLRPQRSRRQKAIEDHFVARDRLSIEPPTTCSSHERSCVIEMGTDPDDDHRANSEGPVGSQHSMRFKVLPLARKQARTLCRSSSA